MRFLELISNHFRKHRYVRVPFRQQLAGSDCGIACLAMILTWHGRFTTVRELRRDKRYGRDGVSAYRLAQLGREYGLETRALAIEIGDLSSLKMPVILHWNFCHFVVLESIGPTAVIVDPSAGRFRCSLAELGKCFTGIALTFSPTAPLGKGHKLGISAWHRQIKALLVNADSRIVLGQLLCCSILLHMIGFGVPLLTRTVLDKIIPNLPTASIGALTLTIGAVICALGAGQFLRGSLLMYLRYHLDSTTVVGFFRHLLSLPYEYFQLRDTGDLLIRLESNSFVRETFTNHILAVTLDASLMIGYAVFLVLQAPLLGAYIVGIAAVQCVLFLATATSYRNRLARELNAKTQEQSYAVEVIQNAEAIKAAAAEEFVLERWRCLFEDTILATFAKSKLFVSIDSAAVAIRSCATLGVLLLGTKAALNGQMTVGTVFGTGAMATYMLGPVQTLLSGWQQIQQASVHLERLNDVLDEECEMTVGTSRDVGNLNGSIEMRDVTFRYSDEGKDVLREISFTVPAGGFVAFVGPSGSGKSTLLKLLLGLHQPTAGAVFYDTVALNLLDVRALRQCTGYVAQAPACFSGTIRSNITLFRPEATELEMSETVRNAVLEETIESLPLGYYTKIGERGSSLSGGQIQRLALARALIRNPRVLFLDEATSHLDSVTEQRLYENLARMACTRIVVAHRLATVQNASKIFVLSEGQIVQIGTHEELISQSGLYSELYAAEQDLERA